MPYFSIYLSSAFGKKEVDFNKKGSKNPMFIGLRIPRDYRLCEGGKIDMNIPSQLVGKNKRMKRLFTDGKAVIVPIDDFLISGPYNDEINIGERIEHIINGKPDAVLGYIGAVRNYADKIGKIPYILNLTASSALSNSNQKILCTSIEQALQIDTEAIAVHINISSKYEGEMLHTLGNIADQCEKYGVPLMAIIYPRTEGSDFNYKKMKEAEPKRYSKILAHVVHIAIELGADIVKTQYSGCKETFARVVDAACGNPLVIAGGEVCEENKIIKVACDAMEAGASGVCFGRNIFLNECPDKILYLLNLVVHDSMPFDEIIKVKKERYSR